MITKGLLLLFSMDAVAKGSYFLLLLLLLMAVSRSKLYATKDFFLLLGFSALYFVADIIYDNGFNVTILCCSLAYLAGFNIYRDSYTVITDKTMEAFRICAAGMAIHGALNLLYEIYSFGGILYGAAHYDVWTQSQSAVTGQMINYVMLVSMAGYIVFNLKKEKILAFLLVIAILHTTIAGGRTLIVLFAISVVSYIGIYFILAKNKERKKIFGYFRAIFAVAVAFAFVYQFNIFNVKNIWKSSYLYYRLFITSNNIAFLETGRFAIKIHYIKNILDYPFGGRNVYKMINQFSHDILFDTMDRVGIIPGVLLGIYIVRAVSRVLKIIKIKKINIYNRTIFLTYILVVLLQFAIEPIIEGAPIFFYVVLFIDGVMSRLLAEEKRGLSNQESLL